MRDLRLFLYGRKAKESGGSADSQNLHKRISTRLLTVLTTSVIVSIEHEKSMFIKQLYDILDIIVTDEQR